MVKVETIKTERLVLRQFKEKDLPNYIDWKKQENYHNFLPSSPKPEEEYKNSIDKIIRDYSSEKQESPTWGIALKETDEIIGSLNISRLSNTHKCCEIGWGLNPKYQKKGYAYESVVAFIAYIFNNLNMNKIGISIWQGNDASIRLAQKLGFEQEGIEKQARVKNDITYNILHYGLLKEDWLKK